MKNNVLIWSVCLTFSAAIAHFLALEYFLYWRFHSFDIIVHLLAGSAVGFFVFWLGQEILRKFKYQFSLLSRHFLYLFLALMVIVGWEIFELYFHIIDSHSYYLVASGKDILSSLVGCLVALYFLKDK